MSKGTDVKNKWNEIINHVVNSEIEVPSLRQINGIYIEDLIEENTNLKTDPALDELFDRIAQITK